MERNQHSISDKNKNCVSDPSESDLDSLITTIEQLESLPGRIIGSVIDLMVYGSDFIDIYEKITLDYGKTDPESQTVRYRNMISARMKFNLRRSVYEFPKNEELDLCKNKIYLEQICLHVKILFKKRIYDVGTTCILRYPDDDMDIDYLYKKKTCSNNFIIITNILEHSITFSKGDTNIGNLHKSNIFFYEKLSLVIVSDFYVRHLKSVVNPIDYWIMAIACMKTVVNQQIYGECAYCNIENCSDERIGHLINYIH